MDQHKFRKEILFYIGLSMSLFIFGCLVGWYLTMFFKFNKQETNTSPITYEFIEGIIKDNAYPIYGFYKGYQPINSGRYNYPQDGEKWIPFSQDQVEDRFNGNKKINGQWLKPSQIITVNDMCNSLIRIDAWIEILRLTHEVNKERDK